MVPDYLGISIIYMEAKVIQLVAGSTVNLGTLGTAQITTTNPGVWL